MYKYNYRYNNYLSFYKPKKYLLQLINYYYSTNKLDIYCNYPLSIINLFIPLPTKLLIDNILVTYDKNNDEYHYNGISNNNIILISDILLPYNSPNIKFPLPFIFPIYDNNNNINIILSNIYYYEITIKDYKINDNVLNHNEFIAIGYGNKNVLYNDYLGYNNNSIGFYSFGNIKYNFKDIKYNKDTNLSIIWKPNDTIGSGIIYINKYIIKIFFTFNEKLIYISNNIRLYDSYFPMINYNYSYALDINFSKSKFKFDIQDLISQYSNNIISTKNSFVKQGKYSSCNNLNINEYQNNIPKKKSLTNNNIYTLYVPINTSINSQNILNNTPNDLPSNAHNAPNNTLNNTTNNTPNNTSANILNNTPNNTFDNTLNNTLNNLINNTLNNLPNNTPNNTFNNIHSIFYIPIDISTYNINI